MNIAPILASTIVMPNSTPALDTNDFLNNLLPISALVVPGLVVLTIMVTLTLRRNRPS